MKKTLLFDIDHTLLDTEKLKVILLEKVEAVIGKSLEEIIPVRNTYLKSLNKGTDFSPKDYLRALSENFSVNIDYLKKAFFEDSNFKKVLYPETQGVLKDLKNNFQLGIFSEGFESFQNAKLKKSGIYDYFDPKIIIIKRRKTEKESLEIIPKGALVVDDNLEVIEELTKNKIKAIWLNRNDSENKSNFSSIKTLSELPKVT